MGASATPPPTPVQLTLRARGTLPSSPLPAIAQGVAKWYGSGPARSLMFALEPAKPVSIALDPGRWVVQAEAEGFWGSPVQLEVGTAPVETVLDLWPAGRVEGSFANPDREELPSDLTVFFRPAPGAPGQEPPPGKTACTLERASFRCPVPVGTLDLRFQAGTFVPRYLWGVTIRHRQAARPGRLELKKGASVLGWVVTADGAPLGEGAKATLRPREGGRLVASGSNQRMAGLALSVPVNARGFFEFDGLSPGAYVLTVERKPYAPAMTSVRVLEGQVTEVANPPLQLEPPRTLRVFVDPPTDPAGEPWSLRLLRLDSGSSVVTTIAEAAAQLDGSWSQAELAPGSYRLQVRASSGDAWWHDEVIVDPPVTLFTVTLEAVEVRGTLLLGDRPLPATLWFGGRWGAVKVTAQSDGEGRFTALLPRSGDWVVGVNASDPAVERELPAVSVEPEKGGRTAEVEIRLPDTVISGRVVHEDGSPVERAIVNAETRAPKTAPLVQTRTGEAGRFELRGLEPGTVFVEADVSEDLKADPVAVEVVEEEEGEPLMLVARRRLRVTGLVASAAGPVPGVRVKAAPVGQTTLSLRTATTDAEGRFELLLPPGARELSLSVGPPGFAFRMLRVPVPEEGSLALGAEASAGTLVIETEEAPRWHDDNAPRIVVLHRGALEPLGYLLRWADLAGQPARDPRRFVIPMMEPGDYTACLTWPAEQPAIEAGVLPVNRCAGGVLNPGGELRLVVPDPEARASP